jgi:hypothetical protein
MVILYPLSRPCCSMGGTQKKKEEVCESKLLDSDANPTARLSSDGAHVGQGFRVNCVSGHIDRNRDDDAELASARRRRLAVQWSQAILKHRSETPSCP